MIVNLEHYRLLKSLQRALDGAHKTALLYPGPATYELHGQALRALTRARAAYAVECSLTPEVCRDVTP